MSNPRKDLELKETRRIMERLVNTPHKPHKPREESKVGRHSAAKKPSTSGKRYDKN